MKLSTKRISSYVDRGNALIAQGQTGEAMKLVEAGLSTYTEKVISAISPYAKADAGLVSLVLRHLADEIERKNEGAKELREGLWKIIKRPELQEKERIQKPNAK